MRNVLETARDQIYMKWVLEIELYAELFALLLLPCYVACRFMWISGIVVIMAKELLEIWPHELEFNL